MHLLHRVRHGLQGACVSPDQRVPWHYKAHIEANCLANGQVFCQRCQDSCEPNAIRFIPVLGRVPTPTVEPDRCNGCGACVQDCPVGSIKVDGRAAPSGGASQPPSSRSQNESEAV